MSNRRITNPDVVRKELREYYEDAELWIPSNPSWRIYRFETIDEDGELNFYRIRDRFTNKSSDKVAKEKLRKHLIRHTPLNAYFSVSCWLNPSKTSHKTYKKEGDGRHHIDKNHFLFSDVVIDCDHMDITEVRRIYNYLESNYSAERFYIVFSGGGFHINCEKLYTNKKVSNPIEREKRFQEFLYDFAQQLINEGFKFDYMLPKKQDSEHEVKINSPTTDTRRVRKLPGTVTKYGNKSEIVPVNRLDVFEPEQVITKPEFVKTTMSMEEFNNRVNALCQ